MSYTKHNFASGDTLLASDLNAMEDQIAQNEQTGSDLKSAVINNSFEIVTEQETSIFSGYVNGDTGSFTDSDQWYSSDYMFVPSQRITIETTLLGNGGFAFYDFNKTYISGVSGNTAAEHGFTPAGTNAQELTIAVPNNAYYIRICAYKKPETPSIYMKGTTTLTDLISKLSNANALNIASALALALSN